MLENFKKSISKYNIFNTINRLENENALFKRVINKLKETEIIRTTRRKETVNFKIDPTTIKEYAVRDAFIRAAKTTKINKIMANGFFIEIMEDANEEEAIIQEKEFTEWTEIAGGSVNDTGEDIDFTRILRRTVDSIVEGDDFYLELVYPKKENNEPDYSKKPVRIHVLDWDTMKIKSDKHGNLIPLQFDSKGSRINGPYEQTIDGVNYYLDKNEVIHDNYLGQGTERYGRSLIDSILMSATIKRWAQLYTNDTFMKQKPKFLVEINADDKEFEKISQQWEESELKPNSDIKVQVSDNSMGKIKITPLTSHQDLQFEKALMDARREILVGMGVPPGSVGFPDSTGWQAEVQLHEFDEIINGYRDFLEAIINNRLLPRFGWNAIQFKFNKANKRDELNELKASVLKTNFMTINEIRKELGLQDIEGGDIISPITKLPVPSGETGLEGEKAALGKAIEENLEKPKILIENVKYKNLSYFKKSFGGSFRNQNIDNRKLRKAEDIKFKKLERRFKTDALFKFEKRYHRDLMNLLNDYIDGVKGILIKKATTLTKAKLSKVASPQEEMREIEELKTLFIIKGKDLGRGITGESFNHGFDMASSITGINLIKTSEDTEALTYLRDMELDIVEGAINEVTTKMKTQIRLGIQSKEGIPEIVKRLESNVKGSVGSIYKNRFNVIARTAIARAMSEGRLKGYERSRVVDRVQALVGLGPDEARLCASALGGSEGGLGKIMTIDEAKAIIPIHPNCTCSWIPVIDEDLKKAIITDQEKKIEEKNKQYEVMDESGKKFTVKEV